MRTPSTPHPTAAIFGKRPTRPMQQVVVTTILCLLLSACGGSDGGDGDGSSGTGTPSTGGSGTDMSGGNPDSNLDTSVLEAADLLHTGSPVPLRMVDPGTEPLFSELGRNRLASLPDSLAVLYEVVENHGPDANENCQTLGAEYSSCSVTNLHIRDADGVLNDGNWRIYFHSIRRILRVDSDQFSVSAVNGDLHYVEPGSTFSGFGSEPRTLKFVTEFSHLIETDFMPRYWLVREGQAPVLIANTDSETDESRYAEPIRGDNRRAFNGEAHELASTTTRFNKNQDIRLLADALSERDVQARIVPRPTSSTLAEGSLDIGGGFSFTGSILPAASAAALTERQAQFMSTNASVPLTTRIDPALPADTYTLIVNADGIDIAGHGMADVFYGAQSLLSLVHPGVGTIPHITVTDSPRFSFRGMHIDSARNFHSVASMRRLMDQMAAYKLNKLHLHLSDDEGWRLEIPSLPELTDVGARRAFNVDANGDVSEQLSLMPQLGSGPGSNNQGTGHYSRSDFVQLLQYARDRYIDVIPEFDMPGHARAAVVAMRARAANLGNPTDINVRIDDPDDTSRYLTVQHYDDAIVNPCVPGTYNFIETLVQDVLSMYQDAGVPLDVWHMGGDEANNIFTGPGLQSFDEANPVPWRGFVNPDDYDFPWARSPACETFIANTTGVDSRDDLQRHFVQRVSGIVANAGIPSFYAYQDIYDDLTADQLSTTNAGVGFWEVVHANNGHERANEFANRGFDTVIAVPDFLYFDFPHEVDPEERGYYWATRFTDTRKVFSFAPENLPQNAETSVTREGTRWSATGVAENPRGFLGMQGQLWSETVRTPEQFDYMLFPRIIALAERAWHRASWELDYVPGRTFSESTQLVDQAALNSDFAGFAAALGSRELMKLDAAGIQYRIPVPGAIVSTGQLDMNTAFPGLPLEFASDGGDFQTWSPASAPASAVRVRGLSANGMRAGRETDLP